MNHVLSGIEHLDTARRNEVLNAIAEAIMHDEKWFYANPSRRTLLRIAFPNEVPAAKLGETWLVVVRPIDPDDQARCSFKWCLNWQLNEAILSGEEIANALFELCDEALGRGACSEQVSNDLCRQIQKAAQPHGSA
jgi:hypothetical protein